MMTLTRVWKRQLHSRLGVAHGLLWLQQQRQTAPLAQAQAPTQIARRLPLQLLQLQVRAFGCEAVGVGGGGANKHTHGLILVTPQALPMLSLISMPVTV
jgi:hypothetical protein